MEEIFELQEMYNIKDKGKGTRKRIKKIRLHQLTEESYQQQMFGLFDKN